MKFHHLDIIPSRSRHQGCSPHFQLSTASTLPSSLVVGAGQAETDTLRGLHAPQHIRGEQGGGSDCRASRTFPISVSCCLPGLFGVCRIQGAGSVAGFSMGQGCFLDVKKSSGHMVLIHSRVKWSFSMSWLGALSSPCSHPHWTGGEKPAGAPWFHVGSKSSWWFQCFLCSTRDDFLIHPRKFHVRSRYFNHPVKIHRTDGRTLGFRF